YASHFTPGIIPVLGQVTPTSICNDPKYKVYYVQLIEPSLFNGGTKTKQAGGRNFSFTYDSWASWPVDMGAPYVEVNGIPGYQPDFNGDRPGIGNSTARPDEISFMVYQDYTNCTNNAHVAEISLPGGTVPIGVEIHQIAFMFFSPGLTDMYFVKWQIINRSSNTWDSTYISVFDDADVGDAACGAGDDAVGCDTLNNVGYVYNADNFDCNHGAAPPAVGFKYLQSPIIFTGNPQDSAFLPYDTLVGYRALGLSGFNYFINGALDPCLNDPDNYEAGYNFMKGLDGCGRTKLNPFTNQPTLFSYDGNACTRTGTNNWFDSTASGRDVRFMQNSGPFTMNSNDTQTVVIGCFVGSGSDNFKSLCNLLEQAGRVQEFYNSNFAAIPLPPQPQVSVVADGDGKIILYWNTISESYNVYDELANTGYWRFEGYNVYQIRPGTSGDNEDDRNLLATYDVVNGIKTVYDSVRVLQPNGTTQIVFKPTAFGDDYQVSHQVVLTQNRFTSGVNDFFINGTSYRFAVTAYGVNLNAGPPFKVLENPVSAARFDVVPNFNIMGTSMVHNKFDTLTFNRPDKVVFPVVLDPLKVQTAIYRLQFKTDSTFNVLRIKNAQVDTICWYAQNRGKNDNRAQIGDGILFRVDTIARRLYGVIADPSSTSQSKNYGWIYTGTRNLQGVDTAILTGLNPSLKAAQSISMGLSWPNGIAFRTAYVSKIDSNFVKTSALKNVKITFGQTQKAYRYRGTISNAGYVDYVDVPFKVELDDPQDTNSTVPRQLNIGFFDGDSSGTWNPKAQPDGGQEIVFIYYSTYSDVANPFYNKNIMFLTQFRQLDITYVWWPRLINSGAAFNNGDIMTIVPYTRLQYQQSPGTVTQIDLTPTTAATIGSLETAKNRNELEMVRVVPNPYYGGHGQETSPFDRFVKFMNLPKTVTIYIYSLNGNLVRQLTKDDNNTTLNWDLLNTDRIPVASGIYISYIDAPGIGFKIIKLAVFTPEERLDAY
ncbi:MAG TPA: hypothetical protein VJ455_03235, partial [Ignavibacteria bacterium]|nr:hypothetical protein [Ignavibacteria bacterium]